MKEIQYIPVSKLHHHPDNPRKDIGDVTELSESIKVQGILQNLTVVPWDTAHPEGSEYEEHPDSFAVVIGNRRLEAGILADVKEVPCVVSDMAYPEQISTMMVENMQRADLTVYEQAQGFQMMLSLGDSVESISEKTGFSKSTVRRRVKMMELDQNTLKEVSERQPSLSDFDQLAQIEDVAARNKCLEKIGTSDFSQSVTMQLRTQAVKNKLPAVKKLLKSSKAKAIEQSDTWGSKYEGFGSYIQISEWDESTALIPEDAPAKLLLSSGREIWSTAVLYGA